MHAVLQEEEGGCNGVFTFNAEISFASFTGLTKQPYFSSVSPQGKLLTRLPQQKTTILCAYRASTD